LARFLHIKRRHLVCTVVERFLKIEKGKMSTNIYNPKVFRKIFANEKNVALTTDFVNACLEKVDYKCIENPRIVEPYSPSELCNRHIGSEYFLKVDFCEAFPRDRIFVESRHERNSILRDGLVFYAASRAKNVTDKENNKHVYFENFFIVNIVFYDAFPDFEEYRHTFGVEFNPPMQYFKDRIDVVVEVGKFLKNSAELVYDNSRLAQWIRAIDTLNRNTDFSNFATDSVFCALQDEANLCKMENAACLPPHSIRS
jgi:hypothetical protein